MTRPDYLARKQLTACGISAQLIGLKTAQFHFGGLENVKLSPGGITDVYNCIKGDLVCPIIAQMIDVITCDLSVSRPRARVCVYVCVCVFMCVCVCMCVCLCVCVLAILKKMLLVSSASPMYIENESGGRRVAQRRLSSLKMEKKNVKTHSFMCCSLQDPYHHFTI